MDHITFLLAYVLSVYMCAALFIFDTLVPTLKWVTVALVGAMTIALVYDIYEEKVPSE